jgi:hypothetical protein
MRMRIGFIAAAMAGLSVLAMAAEGTPPNNRYLPADQVPWMDEGVPGVQLASLWGDRSKEEAGTLLRTPADFHAGPHSHTADYWAVVVEGTGEHWVPSTGEGKGIRLESGSHWTQIKDQPHEDRCVSQMPCVIFLFNRAPYATHFYQEANK